jgi:hypothetical protein
VHYLIAQNKRSFFMRLLADVDLDLVSKGTTTVGTFVYT